MLNFRNIYFSPSDGGNGTAQTISVTLPAGGNTITNPTILDVTPNGDISKINTGDGAINTIVGDNGLQNQDTPKLDTTQTKPIDQTNITNQNTESTIIKIDGIDYKTNEIGDAIKEDGSIFMSKTEIDKFSNTPVSIIDEVEKINNIILKNQNGERLIYEDSPIGIAAREKDILSHGESIGKQTAVQEFLQINPDLADVYTYKQKYGTLEGYGVKVDYETIKFDNKNKDLMKQLVIEAEITTGKTKEKAKQYADFLESNNTLEAEAKESHKLLIDKQVEVRTTQQTAKQQQLNSYFGIVLEGDQPKDLNIEGSLYDTVYKKAKINDITIPKEGIQVKTNDGKVVNLTQDKLFDLAAVSADEHGNTQADLIIGNFLKSPSNKLATMLYILRGGDLSDLVKRETSKQRIIEINTQKQVNNTRSINTTQNNTNQSGVRTPVK